MADVASGPFSSSGYWHGTDIMAASIFRVPWHKTCNSKPPLSYKFWNMVATISGFVIPLMMLLGSQKGILQPQLPFIPFAVLLGPYMLLSICTDSDRVADLALAVTSMAGNPSCVRVLSAATADEGIEAWGRAQCSNMDVAYDQGAGILVDSNPWCSAHECCLVCRFHCSISAAPLFCCFWWLAPFTVTEDSTKSRGFKYGFGSIQDQIIPGIIAPFSSMFTVNVCSLSVASYVHLSSQPWQLNMGC
ncbi:hypothetical protein OIU78_015868 [Salix suchowensis]|nr:hypothetical protein OIU78_015868 [Salix suchowensis]